MRGFLTASMFVARLAVVAMLVGSMAGCADEAPTPTSRSWSAPPANAAFDYQLGGTYPVAADIDVVVRDRTASPVPGKYNICYLNAFQTQPDEDGQSAADPPYGTESWWRVNHPELLLRDSSGAVVIDAEWDEALLDLSTGARRDALADIQKAWLDGCKQDGFAAADPDNLDSYTRSGGLLTRDAAVAYATELVRYAHSIGLAVGQKNAPELAEEAADIGFDFAVSEECAQYAECGDYVAAFRGRVFDIEYTAAGFAAACAEVTSTMSVIRRDLDLVAKGATGYLYQSC